MIVTFTRFDIPINRDRYGGVTMKACVVSDNLMPVMADIIDAATRPVLLRKEFTFSRVADTLSEQQWVYISERVRSDLEAGIYEQAKKDGLAVITRVVFEQQGDELGVMFTATATAMQLLEKGLGK